MTEGKGKTSESAVRAGDFKTPLLLNDRTDWEKSQ